MINHECDYNGIEVGEDKAQALSGAGLGDTAGGERSMRAVFPQERTPVEPSPTQLLSQEAPCNWSSNWNGPTPKPAAVFPSTDQQLSLIQGRLCPPRRHLVISGDISGCRSGDRGCPTSI